MASLTDLGLSEYEARAYRSLLQTGPTTAKELSRVSDVPMGRIYDVLNTIEQYNLVRSQSASRPKKYVAVEPDTGLDRLIEDKRRELEARLDQYESITEELTEELERSEPVEESFWTVAIGAEQAVDLLVERIATADQEMVMVASTFTEQFFDLNRGDAVILAEVENALERGVDIRMLVLSDLLSILPDRLGRGYQNLLAEYDNFRVRASDEAAGTFTLIDRNEVVIEVPHPLNREEPFAMIDFKDWEFADGVRSEFDPLWADSNDSDI
ncbi:MAG: TrmB family transcriptional regulator [Natronomonas sp.]